MHIEPEEAKLQPTNTRWYKRKVVLCALHIEPKEAKLQLT